MDIFNFFRIKGIGGKEKEFISLFNRLIEESGFKYTSIKEFEKINIDPQKIIFILQPEEYTRPLDLIKELPIFEVSKESDKVFLTNNSDVLNHLEIWLEKIKEERE